MTETVKKNTFAPRNMGLLRKFHGDTQEDLAIFLGVTPKQISNYERGVTSFSLELAETICDRYGVSLEDFAKKDLTHIGKLPLREVEPSESPPSVGLSTEGGNENDEPTLKNVLREIVKEELSKMLIR